MKRSTRSGTKIKTTRKIAIKRSSQEARDLIKHAIKSEGTQRKAADLLGITQAQLSGLKTGRLRDTPKMKRLLRLRRLAAQRAYFNLKPRTRKATTQIDLRQIQMICETIQANLDLLSQLLIGHPGLSLADYLANMPPAKILETQEKRS